LNFSQKLKELNLFFLLLFVALGFGQANAQTNGNIFELERNAQLQRIQFEKTRIANDYAVADNRLFNLIDSVVVFIEEQPIAHEKKALYRHHLQQFLTNINRSYSANYLKNGTYLAVLSYYPIIIEWDQKDELLRNIKRYANFSVKAIRLLPSDTVAEDFLTDYLKDHPDEIFRYTEEFDDRKFALRLLEKAVRIAPESVKRYYTSDNAVNTILSKSKDAYVRKSYEIYNRFGIRSRAYLLLDAVVNSNMSLAAADSIGNNPDNMFSLLVKYAMKYEANVTYSIYRYMDIYGIDAMRKVNQEALSGSLSFESFARHTPEEMFVLIGYGYKETTPRTIQQLMTILRKKSTGIPISSAMITSMDKEKLKQLIIYADQQQFLDQLLGLMDEEKKDYVLALAVMEEKEDMFPPFKTFAKGAPMSNLETADKSMNELTKARPPGMVKEDEEAESRLTPPSKTEPTATPKPAVAIDIAPAPIVVTPIAITISDKAKSILQLEKNLQQTIRQIPEFVNQDYAESILLLAAQKEPDELFKKVELFKDKRYSIKILEACALNAPVSVKRYLYNQMHPVNYILQYSTNPVIKKIIEINPQLGYHSKPLLLLDDIAAGRISVKEAIVISENPIRLYSAMVNILSRQNYIGRYSIDREMRDYSLRFIREINDKIASGTSQPFYSVESFTAPQLYFLMLYGREEVFTSTFNGLFNRFTQKIPNGNRAAFIQSINKNNLRDFLSLCASFGVLEEFVAGFNPNEKQTLLAEYVGKLELEKDNLSSVVLIAEALSNLKDYQLLLALQSNLKREYNRVFASKDQIGISIYGVLSSIVSGNAKTETDWYKQVTQQFNISPINSLTSEALFNNDNICIEQMYFYNDDDGRSSFINFINAFKSQPNWKIEDRSNYVRVYSTEGKQIEILANKPEQEQNGINAINSYLLEKNTRPSVIVHRGHSFHTESTLEKVPPGAKLIFVGSCGGFYKLSIALQNAPEAHIISTKQIGTKSVNDAMLFALNEQIRQGREIVWNEFWERMKERLGNNPYFSDYIPPNKNLESIFIKAYYKILGV
jgi:hypothetical protein